MDMANQQQQGQQRVSDKIEPSPNVVFFGGIPPTLQSGDELVQFLTQRFGAVEAFKLVMDNNTGKHKGYGFAKFAATDVANNVRQMRLVEFQGKMMNVGDAYTGGGQTQQPNNRRGGQPNRNNGGVYSASPYMYMQQGGQQGLVVSQPPAFQVQGQGYGRGAGQGQQAGGNDTCRYFLRGACRKGPSCPYRHTGGQGGQAMQAQQPVQLLSGYTAAAQVATGGATMPGYQGGQPEYPAMYYYPQQAQAQQGAAQPGAAQQQAWMATGSAAYYSPSM